MDFNLSKHCGWLLSCAVLSSTVAIADDCQLARQVAKSVLSDQQIGPEQKLAQMQTAFPPHGCVAPNYSLQLGILQYQIPAEQDHAEKNFKKAVQQANKEESVLRAHSLAWYSRVIWEAVSDSWSETVQESERAEAYKEARNAKEIYNQKYPGQELAWFDDYLLDMGEQLANPSVVAIAAQLDVQTISRDAVATAAGNRVELRINFEKNSAKITPTGLGAVDRLLTAVDQVQQQSPDKKLQLQLVGHTSTEGSDSHNRALSQRRADAVKAAIIQRRPKWADEISASGLGESQPIYSQDKRELMRRANRRVEIKLRGL